MFICLRQLLALTFLLTLICCQEKHAKVQEAEDLFGFEIITDQNYRSYSNGIRYNKVDDSIRIANYVAIFIQEFRKYPTSYFDKINLKKVILCNDLYVGNTKRAGYPDPKRNTLVLSIDSFEKRIPYVIHIMHHELHHCTEFALYGTMYYRYKEWQSLNEPNFTYGNGGGDAYLEESKDINWYWLTHPKNGFPNWYATTGEEEDRSELVALLMNKSRRDTLVEYCRRDLFLKKKVLYMVNELNNLVETKSNYWEAVITEFDANEPSSKRE